jgi:hypothetical protein
MQTFLPFPDFKASAAVLDRQRLGKQRIEVVQLLRALLVPGAGWANHPAAKMWRGYEKALARFGLCACVEWIERGYKDSQVEVILGYMDGLPETGNPPWLGRDDVHEAYRSNLLRKAPEYYRPFWPDNPDNLPYVWPVE